MIHIRSATYADARPEALTGTRCCVSGALNTAVPLRGFFYRGALISICFCVAFGGSCVYRNSHSFLIVPESPNYLLRAPDAHEIPFPEILRSYNGYEPGRRWMDILPLLEMRLENAYYVKGAPRGGIEGFLGTEIARYKMTAHGLILLSFQSMKDRPAADLPVQDLISRAQMKHRFYRLYFEIFFKRKGFHGSMLLGADSVPELDRLSSEVDDPEKVCSSDSNDCTVFPEACSVSAEMEIVVNGKNQTVLWRVNLADVVKDHPHHLVLKRFYAGRLTPVQINAEDPNDLKLPLLPGDQVIWR